MGSNPTLSAMFMNRIDRRFRELKSRGQKGLVTYICAGDPTLDVTARLVAAFDLAGADVVELGIPFSDPLADGVVNQLAAQRALASGTAVPGIFAMARALRDRGCAVPLCLFTYFNPVHRYGVDRFAADAAAAGVDGILTLDLPPEEAPGYVQPFRQAGIATVFLVAPTSPDARIRRIVRAARGFVYYVSREGVTGERGDLPADMCEQIAAIRRHTRLPIAVGFGVATPDQARRVAEQSDAVVVGSAIVRRVAAGDGGAAHVAEVAGFVGALAEAVHGSGGMAVGERRDTRDRSDGRDPCASAEGGECPRLNSTPS